MKVAGVSPKCLPLRFLMARGRYWFCAGLAPFWGRGAARPFEGIAARPKLRDTETSANQMESKSNPGANQMETKRFSREMACGDPGSKWKPADSPSSERNRCHHLVTF